MTTLRLLLAQWHAWRRAAAARTELASMGERQLCDLGIGRSQVPWLFAPAPQRPQRCLRRRAARP